jgi:hypothetical protein
VKTLLDVMIQGRFKLSKKLAHVDNSAYLPHARRTEVEEHVEELQAQLGRFRDHSDGSISGKGEDKADDDDLAMATLLVVYWSVHPLI